MTSDNERNHRMIRRALLLLAALVVVAFSADLWGMDTARASASTYHPVITIAGPHPSAVKGSGGTVTVNAQFSGPFAFHKGDKGQFCHLVVVKAPVPVKLPVPNEQNCLSRYTNYVKVGANSTTSAKVDTLALVVSHTAKTASKSFTIDIAGSSPAPVTTTTTTAPPGAAPFQPVVPGGGGSGGPSGGSTTTTSSPSTTSTPATTTTTAAPVTTTTAAPPPATTTTTAAPATTTTTTPPTPPTTAKPPCPPPPCHTDNGRGNDGCNGGNDDHHKDW